VKLAALAIAAVVGGHTAAINRFPFQALLINAPSRSRAAGAFCGAVVRDATHVMTAAHCVFEPARGQARAPATIRVLAGSATIGGRQAKVVAVAHTAFDPAYDGGDGGDDVALLTLSKPLYGGTPTLGRARVAPLAPDATLAAADSAPGTAVTVSGWGDTCAEPSEEGRCPSFPARLHAATTHVVDSATCTTDFALIMQLAPTLLCAGEPAGGIDACQRDSGGPLVVQGADPPDGDVLVGIVSGGAGCGQPGTPGLYSSVADGDVAAFLASDPAQAPRDSVAPTLTGDAVAGQTLTCAPGTWSGGPTFQYTFMRDEGIGVAPLVLQGGSSPTYVLTADDLTTGVWCRVAAVGSGGYGFAQTAEFPPR
jgi:trypsin